jgi:hypothetical protein
MDAVNSPQALVAAGNVTSVASTGWMPLAIA